MHHGQRSADFSHNREKHKYRCTHTHTPAHTDSQPGLRKHELCRLRGKAKNKSGTNASCVGVNHRPGPDFCNHSNTPISLAPSEEAAGRCHGRGKQTSSPPKHSEGGFFRPADSGGFSLGLGGCTATPPTLPGTLCPLRWSQSICGHRAGLTSWSIISSGVSMALCRSL